MSDKDMIETDCVVGQYVTLLTPYSFSFLRTQLEHVDKVKIVQDADKYSCDINSEL